ncbi:MAG TPA: hypothetical protein VK395_19015 [Gemmataceae bacterium]|nr:hypothetical protein [Gemmataceae bacterium]
MWRFIATTEGSDKLGLRETCEVLANDLWVPDHLTAEQAALFVADHFKRTILAELELLDVRCIDDSSSAAQ